ncbi:hypothetical protein BKA70DRAFT_487888 [Coprinopsis sp. MPI-PUGE-AT-0042]|nr:hypothetical protein BKA70DRAFT_487888 [Coprinopsis sp. MPI-PUGE-AT-0042]
MTQVPLDHLDIHTQLAFGATPVRMPHEIYIKHLYPQGYGYPCANPKPWGDSHVKIGDIGLIVSDRFNVLDNLYCLPESFLCGKPVPVAPIVYDPEVFGEGSCITGGVDGCEVKMSAHQSSIDEITFSCCQKEGAILAVTSPAELREVKDHSLLRRYLCENAASLFAFLAEHHALPHGSSIYVVTGTILSATWATATHSIPMHPSHNTLVLKREVPSDQSRKPFFVWTKRGNARTQTQGSQAGEAKDQCLFLRGFLITASPAVWMARSEATKVSATHTETQDLQREPQQGHVNAEDQNEDTNGKGHQAGRTTKSRSFTPSSFSSSVRNMGAINVHPLPPQAAIASDYPSYRINNMLLNLTDAVYAITHEDDWRDAVVEAAGNPKNLMDEDRSYEVTVERLWEVIPRQIESVYCAAYLVGHLPVERLASAIDSDKITTKSTKTMPATPTGQVPSRMCAIPDSNFDVEMSLGNGDTSIGAPLTESTYFHPDFEMYPDCGDTFVHETLDGKPNRRPKLPSVDDDIGPLTFGSRSPSVCGRCREHASTLPSSLQEENVALTARNPLGAQIPPALPDVSHPNLKTNSDVQHQSKDQS